MVDPYAAKPWLAHYDPHVPPQLDYPEQTLAQAFAQAAARCRPRPALHYLGRTLTFEEIDALSERFAAYLQRCGVAPGEVVGVNLPNIPAYYAAVIGIQKAGAVLTGVSPLLTARELAFQLNDAGAKVLLTLDALFGRVAPALPHTGVRCVCVASAADFLPSVKRLLGRLFRKIPSGPVTPLEGIDVCRFNKATAAAADHASPAPADPDAPCLMQYTGGTTGPPKGAVLTHRNIVSHMSQVNTWVDLHPEQSHTILSAFPLFHQAGLFLAIITLCNGSAQVAVPDPRNLDHIIASIARHRPTAVVNVPTIFLELLKDDRFRQLDFTPIQWFLSGAAPFPPEYIKTFENAVGAGKLIEVLGMTETSPVTTALPRYGLKKAGSVGLPLPDTEVRLLDPDTGAAVPVGEPGELVARGPQVFTRGYHNRPEETAATLRDGWIYTGDVCRMDADGFFYVVDRIKDMLNVSGFKVFTREVDDHLMEHPDVDAAATVGLADPQRPGSEIVAAAVVLQPGVERSDRTRQSLTAFMREQVAPYKVPKMIEFLDELPKSPIGKVLKRELREMLARDR